MELIPGLTNDLARECLIRVPIQSIRPMLSVSKAWNSELRNPEFHRHRQLSGHTRPVFIIPQPSEDSYYSTTATYSVTVFDPETGSCTKLPPGPGLPAQHPPVFFRLAGVGSKVVLFIAGGNTEIHNVVVHVFDFLTGQWREGAGMPGPGRVFFGLACDSVGGKCLIAGGLEGQAVATTTLRSTLLYDVAGDTWEALGDMENERTYCEAMFYGGKFHVVGGFEPSNETERYRPLAAESLDPDTSQWGPYVEDFIDEYLDGVHVFMGQGEGQLFSFYIGQGQCSDVDRRGARWQAVTKVPEDFRSVETSCVMMWREKLMLIGLDQDVWRAWAYVWDLKSRAWSKMLLPEYFNDYHPGVFGCGMDL